MRSFHNPREDASVRFWMAASVLISIRAGLCEDVKERSCGRVGATDLSYLPEAGAE